MMYILRLKNNLLSENANHLLGRSGGGISGEIGIDIYTSCSSVVKNLPANAGDRRDTDSIPGLGRFSGVGNVNPLQYSCPGTPMDREAWQATVHIVTKSQI